MSYRQLFNYYNNFGVFDDLKMTFKIYIKTITFMDSVTLAILLTLKNAFMPRVIQV